MKPVEKIIQTDEERKKELKIINQIFDLTNELFDKKLCGYSVTLTNGWKVSLKNKRYSKQIGVPMS